MAVNVLPKAVDVALGELARKRKTAHYFDDPVAWATDVPGAYLWSKQQEAALAVVQHKNTAVKAGHGVGKALSLDTPIATTAGWTTVGQLRVGEYVFDESGRPTRVVAKSDVFDMPMYEITYSDGAVLRTNAPHESVTLDHREAKAARRTGNVTDWRDHWDAGSVRETCEIAASVTYANGRNRNASNHIVPINGALDLPDADLPLDPYVTGAWLGDGTSCRAEMTVGDESLYILDEFQKAGYALTKTPCGKYRYTFARQGFVQVANGLNLMNNKHIPSDYQRASIRQRKELLRGLMDTDGFVAHGNLCGIDLMNEELAYDTVELIRGLGVRASISPERTYLDGRDVGVRYRIVFNSPWSPFTAEQYKDLRFRADTPLSQTSRRTMRTVVSVAPAPNGLSQCIQVDSERHLFLAGEHLVPTHNSFLMALMICWWLDTRYPNAFVATTAPSQAQVGAILWREVRKMKLEITKRHKEYERRKSLGLDTTGYPDHELPGYITAQNEWKLEGGTILGFGRKPPENKEDDSFQGLHDGYVLAIGDEACGLTEELIDALSNITSNPGSRRVLIANPTNPASHFGKIFRENTGAWDLRTISVLDSPNFTEEGKNVPADILAKLTGPEYVEDKRKEYGEDSPRYKSRVLGEFAYDLGDTLIKPEDIAVAVDAEIVPLSDEPVYLGVDVARFGKDASVIYVNQGGRVRYVSHLPEDTRVTQVASWTHKWAVDMNASEVRVDGHGIGGGVVDLLVAREDRKYTVIAMNSNGATPDRKQWHNNRAYWWDEFRKALRSGKIDLDIDDVEFEKVQDELSMVTYKFSAASGGLLMESKDEMKKRGIKSPDFADALIYACADSEYLYTSTLPKKETQYQDPGDIIGDIPLYLTMMTDWA